jgi:hypothetical protein
MPKLQTVTKPCLQLTAAKKAGILQCNEIRQDNQQTLFICINKQLCAYLGGFDANLKNALCAAQANWASQWGGGIFA